MTGVMIKVPYKRGDWTRNAFIGHAGTQTLISELEIYVSVTKETFYIQPYNSAGSATSAKLRLPCDPEMLTKLIDALDEIRATSVANAGDKNG